MKKLTALILILAIILTVMLSCSSNSSDNSNNSNNGNKSDPGNAASAGGSGENAGLQEDAQNQDTGFDRRSVSDDLPEKNYGGDKFNILYIDWSSYQLYQFADSEIGEIMNDTIYYRYLNYLNYPKNLTSMKA